ncbi:MAG: N-acetylmuramic acid 6-phosphate etherase [Chitinophagales bacterium]|nr:N-acetylmuramic acid 6-phosphate etherase [Chitinophagales bacterium]
MIRTTEQDSKHRHLEQKTTRELLEGINQEDKTVAYSVEQCIDQISRLVDVVADRLLSGGRLFYIGAGTSGRLGVVDASECPPTFGVSHDLVIGLISGGDQAIRKAVEFAEDDTEMAWKDLQAYQVNEKDFVIGIAASGTTPYVIGGIEKCKENKIASGCITCNLGSPLASACDYPIECVVGPEFLTGSTRMKAGTAQKMILNMISTAAMIKIGRVEDNKMVNMQLSNNKLVARGIKMIMNACACDEDLAHEYLERYKSVKEAILKIKNL